MHIIRFGRSQHPAPKIDTLVSGIYGLTAEEIRILEKDGRAPL